VICGRLTRLLSQLANDVFSAIFHVHANSDRSIVPSFKKYEFFELFDGGFKIMFKNN
jgi:hypothetical protein